MTIGYYVLLLLFVVHVMAVQNVDEHICPNGENEMIRKCCKGYVMINGHCKPNCKNCLNGVCNEPDVCQCNDGFIWNQSLQSCQQFGCYCENGYCSQPGQCVCNKGYRKLESDFCEPICDDPVCPKYSTCVAPQQCKCHDEYEMNPENGECELQCDDAHRPDNEGKQCVLKHCSCTNSAGGYCLHNYNECSCYDGYRKTNDTHCEHLCQEPCVYADCTGPNHCQCLDDYHQTADPNVCEEENLCYGKPCDNGVCLLGGICKCKSGYNKSLNVKFQIICDSTTMFIAKIMSLLLGVPLILAGIFFLIVYLVERKRNALNIPTVQYAEDEDGYVYAFNN
ncbi:uncharacterized protein [Musca autumnalis]|uniref:uncharacterized protein n=1 Tax=Musca autumnalis TaxID=221902 RepID=UPI003CF6C8CD